jgi:phosphate uptake regulator
MKKRSEYRKIQLTGKGSYIITLPKYWVENQNLTKGDSVVVEIKGDSSLQLLPIEESRNKGGVSYRRARIITFNREEDFRSLCRKITSLYLLGVDLIQIKAKGNEMPLEYRELINNLCRNVLLGSEIVDEKPNDITIQVLTGTDFSIESAIRRMTALAMAANSDAFLTLKGTNEKLIHSIDNANRNVRRLYLYVIRQLKYGLESGIFRELGFETKHEFLGYRILSRNVMNIADDALTLANDVMAISEKVDKKLVLINKSIYEEILELNSKACLLFEKSIEALFKRDYGMADRLVDEIDSYARFMNVASPLVRSGDVDSHLLPVIRLVTNISKRIIDYSMDIAEIALNRSIETVSQKL